MKCLLAIASQHRLTVAVKKSLVIQAVAHGVAAEYLSMSLPGQQKQQRTCPCTAPLG